MKKIISIILVAILLLAGLFVLTGCGDEKTEGNGKASSANLSAYAGTYKGEYTKFVGDEDKDKNTTREFSLELNADGTGLHKRDDSEFKVTWSVDGEKFTMSETFIGTIEYTGTLKDGKLDIFNGDPTNDLTCEYVYSK